MDVKFLHDCFLATLQADPAVRHQAETQLSQAELNIGFLGACLDILGAPDVSPVVKKACTIYFKNKILRSWSTDRNPIDEDEKPLIRERIIPVMVKLDRSLRSQFIVVLNTILSYDYPSKWPNYIDIIKPLFGNPNDIQAMYTGVLCFSELARHYRWKTNDSRATELDPIIIQYFPSLLQIGKSIISDPSSLSDNHEYGEIVKLIVKAYKFVTYHDLPDPLQEQEALVNWCSFQVDVINMQLPQNVLELDEEDRYLSPWVKSQKWAFANLYRIFQRYGSKSLSQKFSYDQFRDIFTKNVVPQLLSVYFTKIESWRSQKQWISDASMYYIVLFLEQCVIQKECWLLIKPHVSTIISEIAFPLLCPTETIIDLFDNDPLEYIHLILDVYEESSSPHMAVLALIFTMVEKRQKTTLEPILQFTYEKLSTLSNVEETEEIAKQKESCLRIIGGISHKLVNKKTSVYNQIEPFLGTFVVPNFKSKFAFLRARTCEIVAKFDTFEFNDQSVLNAIFQGVMNCFNESDFLPVQLEGALAIQSFMSFDQFKEALGAIIVDTMEKLLNLSNKIDTDAISGVIQECVENYSEQLQPFGTHLMSKLSEQLLRILTELKEASNSDPDNYTDDIGDYSEKHSAAMGVFNTMVTVLLYFENSVEIISKLEEYYVPVLNFALENRLDDFYAEISELIENTTFLTRSVSPAMWSLFPSLMDNLINGDVTIYLDDCIAALKNYLIYGNNELRLNIQYQQLYINLINSIFNPYLYDQEDSEIGTNDIILAAEIAQNLILALDRETASPYIPNLCESTMSLLSTDDPAHSHTNRFQIHLVNIIIASLIIDTNTTLNILINKNAFQNFLALWFKLLPDMKRIFDLKLSVLGFLNLIYLDLSNLKELKIESIIPEFGTKLVLLLTILPQAMKEMENRRINYDPEKHFAGNIIGAGGEEGDWEDEDEDTIETSANAAADDYLKFLEEQKEIIDNGGNAFGFQDDEDDFDEDPYSNTVLDNINVFKAFKDCFITAQSSDANKYSLLISKLTPSDQEILQSICNESAE
ncbi:hypothetical protein BVG19_g766 [[Candida] boidinii]|nr:hypothetical protein BVG19_g766 [[Candida] boidinii]OWB50778.1 hypothetical protein B5S27_g2331 [[Candida] boidinii]